MTQEPGRDGVDPPRKSAEEPAVATSVSRARYERERRARREAETLLEAKSRELYETNQALLRQAGRLERAVQERTADVEAARSQADSANVAKSDFLANMSHEIRTPLNGILGMAASLGDTSLSQAQREMLALIVDCGDLLLSVINDVLDLSKIEAGRLEVESVPFDLSEAVRSVERLYRLKAEEKGLEFVVDLQVGGWVSSDPMRLRQVLGNLLSNAIKFTETGRIAMRVTENAEGDGRNLISFDITDSGIGIPADQMSRIFTPYAQGSAGTARRFGGSGLGLTISRQLCRTLGGDLNAYSGAGAGSRFVATIAVTPAVSPARQAPVDADQVFTAMLARRPLCVMLADDNLTNQLVLKSLLRRYPLKLQVVANGQEAVRLWQAEGCDLILMDVQMPIMDGVEATHAIRRSERETGRGRTPIIALSANVMQHQVKGYLAAGMDISVGKPVNKDVLLQAMLAVLPPD